jgi:hypothetical protein
MRNTEKFLFLFYCHHNLSISLHLKFLKRVIVSSRMLSWMQAVPQLLHCFLRRLLCRGRYFFHTSFLRCLSAVGGVVVRSL